MVHQPEADTEWCTWRNSW